MDNRGTWRTWLGSRPRSWQLWRVGAVALDGLVAVLSIGFAYAIATGNFEFLKFAGVYHKAIGILGLFAIFYWFFGLQRGTWRYVSITDLMTIVKISLATTIAFTLLLFLSLIESVPRLVPILTTVFLIMGMGATRLFYRVTTTERTFFGPGSIDRPANRLVHNVLLYGLTDNTEIFLRANRRGGRSALNVVGVIDDRSSNRRRTLHGIEIVGDLKTLKQVVSRFEKAGVPISELIVTDTQPSHDHLAKIVESAAAAGVKTARIPDFGATSALGGRVEPKAIDLGDLLGRPEITADINGVARLINNNSVLVTGAGGSIGSELCRQIAEFAPRELVLTDNSEFLLFRIDMELREAYPNLRIVSRIMNVADVRRVGAVFSEFRPDVVFHAAGLKHVAMVENNRLEAIKTNLFGTRNVADAALAHSASSFIMISTDKAVSPSSTMGATKRAAEAYCQSLDISSAKTRLKIVRFGNVLGSNGSVVPRFRDQIAKGGPITVTHPQVVRFFMTIPEAVRLVLNASADEHGEPGSIMILDMGNPVKIVDLATRMIQLAGYRPHIDIDIVFTGLQPGEKLHEELIDKLEIGQRRQESHYLFVSSPGIIETRVISKTLRALEEAVSNENVDRSLTLLAHIVPDFRAPSAESIIPDQFEQAPF